MHDNIDYDNKHDNLKHESVHDMDNKCIPPCQEEIPLENAEINFDVHGSSPQPSSSYIPPLSRELRSGSSFLTELLLHNHMTGITASPFIADINALQKAFRGEGSGNKKILNIHNVTNLYHLDLLLLMIESTSCTCTI
jgi:hypothetical protein